MFNYNSTNLNSTTFIDNAENNGSLPQAILPKVLLSAAPLLVGLSTFTAKTADGAAVRRTWTTATARNNGHFKVARSVNGKLFATVETVTGAGISHPLFLVPPAGALVPSAPQTGIGAGPGRRPLVLVELVDEAGSEVDLAGDLDFAAQGLDVGFD